eukprot:1061943-Amphidinium_carterae.1
MGNWSRSWCTESVVPIVQRYSLSKWGPRQHLRQRQAQVWPSKPLSSTCHGAHCVYKQQGTLISNRGKHVRQILFPKVVWNFVKSTSPVHRQYT